jgi:adenylate cyclase
VSRYSKAIAFGFIIGLLGVVASLLTIVDDCDQRFGLDLLFNIRGPRQAPPETVIVSIDRESAQRLDIQRDPVKWPRAAHAELLDVLKAGGARFVAFDILFDEPRDPRDDEKFAAAIRKAGNVILCGCTLSEHLLLHGNDRKVAGAVMIESFLPPIPLLAASALATASFPLPRMPARIDQCWSFKLGNTPTLPVVALQLYGIDVYDVFVGALAKGDLNGSGKLPKNKESLLDQGKAQQAVRALRDLFQERPSLGSAVFDTLEHSPDASGNPEKSRLVHALLDMYTSDESRFINYYGPARTIATIPYFKVIQTQVNRLDFRGKAVFVGISEDFRAEQVGGFQTVFSGPEGDDLSSVELAATVFSNLLEGSSIEMISPRSQLFLLLAWGMLVGIVCRLLAMTRASIVVTALAAVYFGAAYYQFKVNYQWLPLFAPLLIQAPAALTCAIVTHYLGIKKEREDVRKAMGYYLPDDVIDHMVRNIADFKEKSDVVHGTVLFADAEKYSTLAESMEPAALKTFMNRFYEVLFTPVRKYNGRVLDVVGDAMLAIWYGESLSAETRSGPCRAALEMAGAVEAFNSSADGPKLPVRIGVHSGHVSIGTVGAIDHYEYRAVGDCVNTASRLEGLNKYLKTRILVSEDVIAGLEDFLARPLGRFILAGKVNALPVYELMGDRDKVHGGQFLICETFGRALEAYRKKLWSEAIRLFEEVLEMSPEDGPSSFYLMLCREFLVKPPPDGWEGSVSLASK